MYVGHIRSWVRIPSSQLCLLKHIFFIYFYSVYISSIGWAAYGRLPKTKKRFRNFYGELAQR